MAKKVSNKYRIVDTSTGRYSFGRHTEDPESSSGKESKANSLPNSLANFQPKAVITVKNSDMTTHVMFHGFKDVLAVCDGLKVGLWSLENGNRLGCVDRQNVRNSNLSAHYGRADASGYPTTSSNLSRITALSWLNQSTNSLLLTGADDGTVHIWRDNLDGEMLDSASASTEANTTMNSGQRSPPAGGSQSGSGVDRISPSLAGAFLALPDIASSNRGSGMISDWQQHSGVLAVAGNSETIRLWDVNREQCARVLHTSSNKCATAISCQSVAWKSSYDAPDAHAQSFGARNLDSRGDSPTKYWSWMFAGFGDGSVAVFDQRVSTEGGKVHSARDDNHWIVHASVREDIPEVSFCEKIFLYFTAEIINLYWSFAIGYRWGTLWGCQILGSPHHEGVQNY